MFSEPVFHSDLVYRIKIIMGRTIFTLSLEKPGDEWSCKRSPGIWASYKHKIYKTWKKQGQEIICSNYNGKEFPMLHIPSFVEIDQLVPVKKIFEGFFTIYGHGGYLGHVTSIMSKNSFPCT